ncbi:hypothetical protein C8Q80DRAFT_1113459 [Daedaleopsis nitida]|nr:hypothetical protein C8Q80DRAFT_1113459 [Daedaleopsis nitida]
MLLPQWSGYQLLHTQRRTITGRHVAPVLACLAVISYIAWTFLTPVPPHPSVPHTTPPLYSAYHEEILRLPQHNWNQSRPRDDEKFFYVAGHLHGLGWNNALQELLFNAYLAYRSGRSNVFSNYTWEEQMPYATYNGRIIPSQIPFTALIRGPIVGDPWPADASAPLSVSWDYFHQLCPQKYELNENDVNEDHEKSTSAAIVTDRWSAKLKSVPEACVQSTYDMKYVYSFDYIFGVRSSLVDIWPEFSKSPIMTRFFYSSLVELAFDTNRDLFLPPGPAASEPLLTGRAPTTNAERYPLIPGLLVLHVRRGDYAHHCTRLRDRHEDFISTNTLLGSDPFDVPQPGLADEFLLPADQRLRARAKLSADAREYYRRRCFPSVPEMAAKVAEVLRTPAARGLRRVFIMTNAKEAFISDLREALLEVADWEMVASSRDVALSWEQQYISQAVDSLAAQRAQVLIGNGFSSLTSNAVLFRMANNFPPESSRFW